MEQILLHPWVQFYVWGAIITGSIKAIVMLLSFMDPECDAFTIWQTIGYYILFVLAFVLWPAEAVQLFARTIGYLRARAQEAKQHRW